VEGTLKPEMKHVYSRRVFYIDEDSWQIAVADNYDKDGKLWRTAEAHTLNYYEVPVHWSTHAGGLQRPAEATLPGLRTGQPAKTLYLLR
jgi:hypothetical protein